jgi:hypothetical protein
LIAAVINHSIVVAPVINQQTVTPHMNLFSPAAPAGLSSQAEIPRNEMGVFGGLGQRWRS